MVKIARQIQFRTSWKHFLSAAATMDFPPTVTARLARIISFKVFRPGDINIGIRDTDGRSKDIR